MIIKKTEGIMEKKFVREKTIKKKYAAIIISTHEDLMHDEDNKAYVVYKLPKKDLSFIACPDKDRAVEFASRIFSALGVNFLDIDLGAMFLDNLNTEYRVCCEKMCVSFGLVGDEAITIKNGKPIKCINIINDGVMNYEQASIKFDDAAVEQILNIDKIKQ